MTPERCSMAPLVEARRDERLSEREVASLERHLAICASCADLAADLARITSLLRAPSRRVEPLVRQRGRVRLLRDAALRPAPRPTRRSRPALLLVAVAAVVALPALALAALLRSFGVEHAATPPRAVVMSDSGFIAPPRGTATLVEAEEPSPPPPDLPSEQAASAPSAVRPRLAAARRAPDPRPTVKPLAPGVASDFVDGVHLIERGSFSAAADRLDAFSAAHPEDSNAEDAAFLAIVSLQRAGRLAAATAAAQRYLDRYPHGYRRAEAAQIAATGQGDAGR